MSRHCLLRGHKLNPGEICPNEGTTKHQKRYTDGQAILPGKGEWAPR